MHHAPLPKHISLFQSTHPVRGATARAVLVAQKTIISIHAPREGCDVYGFWFVVAFLKFQSTHPVRGATWLPGFVVSTPCDFNPRTP